MFSLLKELRSPAPAFTLDGERFDQRSFFGRVLHFYNVTDFRLMFVTHSELDRCVKRLDYFKRNGRAPAGDSNDDLWYAQKVVEAIIHPDTGERIPLMLRFSAFAPMNIPICAGLLWPNPTPIVAGFFQWINASYNTAVNYANRNASSDMSLQQMGAAYTAAVGSSIGIAVGMNAILKKMGSSGASARIVVPATAAATAGMLNVMVIRSNELKEGISVRSPNGRIMSRKSKKAGQHAISQVAMTRCMMSMSLLAGPAIVMSRISRFKIVSGNRINRMACELGVLSASLFTAVPCSIAIFPQIVTISAEELEPWFSEQRDKNGNLITFYTFNKGL